LLSETLSKDNGYSEAGKGMHQGNTGCPTAAI
jgi:hypothetical protein